MPPAKPKKNEDPIVFEDLHEEDASNNEGEDEDSFAPFAEGEDPWAMPDADQEPDPETKKRPAIEAVEDEGDDDDDLVGQEDDPVDGDEDEADPDEEPEDDDDELAAIKNPALREKILADRRRLTAQDSRISQLSQLTVDQTKSILENRKKEIGGRIDGIKADMVKAKEDGETKTEVDKLADLQKAQIELGQVTTQEEQLAAALIDDTAAQPQDLNPRSTEARKYLDANSWLNDKRFDSEREAMGIIDKSLATEGYDINSAEYFNELDRRLRKKFVNLPGRGKPMKKPKKQIQKKRSTVAGVDRAGVPKGRSRSGKVVLTSEDRANMERFSLDPSDPDHVRAYAAEKRKIDMQEEQRQG